MSSTIDEVIKTVKVIAKSKKYTKESIIIKKYTITINTSNYGKFGVYLTIKDKPAKNEHWSQNRITIYLSCLNPNDYGFELLKEVVDISARNYKGVKGNLKDNFLCLIRGVYNKIVGKSIKSNLGSCEPHEELAHFLDCIRNWSNDEISYAYRVISPLTRNSGNYSIFITDLHQVLNQISMNDSDFDDLQLKLEESLLMQI
jgi:hypothetical protein